MVSDSTFGRVGLSTKASSRVDRGMATAYGKRVQEAVTSLKASIEKIRKMAMVFSLGLTATFTRATTRTISEKVTGRCIG